MGRRKFICTVSLLAVFISFHGQVNLQTGSATFSLPMFNWQDDKSRLNAIVALNYSSGNGLKVNDVASNVGQGWNLVAGGVITRMQVGEPDDQQAWDGSGNHANQDYTDQDITKYPAGYLYATEPPSKGCPDALRKYPIYKSMNQLYTQHNITAEDKQQDYFSFQFNGKAGMFVLEKSNANGYIGIPLGDTKMKISFQHDVTLRDQRQIRTTITSFTVQDVDGLIYKFTRHGLTKVLQAGFCDVNGVQLETQPNIENAKTYQQTAIDNNKLVNPWIISSWYLTEISDPLLTQRKITFTYENRNITAYAGADISYNNSNNKYIIVSYKKSITVSPFITNINYPDGHSVTFNYGANRSDFNGDKALSNVEIKYDFRFLSRYQLNTTYFLKNRYGTPVSEYQKSIARLCLKSVKKIGVDLKENSPPYIFDYYLGSNAADDFVPPPFYYKKDIWGCYNGNNSVDYKNNIIPGDLSLSQLNYDQLHGLCFLNQNTPDANSFLGLFLNPKAGYAKNGLLKQIVYPTGGSLTYSYSQNTGKLDGVNTVTTGGVNVSQTSTTDGGYSNGCSNPVVTHYNYVLADGVTSSLWGIEMPINHTFTTNNHYNPEWKSWRYSLRNWSLFGECYWHFIYPGILSQQQSISLSGFQSFMSAAAPYLSILSIVSTISDFATVIGGSTGFLAIVAVIIDIICGLITVGITCLSDNSKDTPNTVYYNLDLNSVSPLPAQFKRVEVVENTGTIGKTIQEFTSAEDPDGYAIWFPSPDMAFPARQRFAPWAYGLPRKTTVLDASGNKIKETENKYEYYFKVIDLTNQKFNMPGRAYTSLMSCKCAVVNAISQRSSDWSSSSFYNDPASYKTQYGVADANGTVTNLQDANMKVVEYGMYTGRAELTTTYDRVFKAGDPNQFVETITNYNYNYVNNYDVNLISTTQSNGDNTQKDITYSSDYSSGVLATLAQNNIISLPVSTTTYINKAGGGGLQVLSEKVTEYAQLSNGDIKPSRIFEQRFTQPIATLPNPSSYKINQVFNYDASGNLIGLKDEGGRSVQNIYDYNDKYIVAAVINSDPSLDKADYTSFETESAGGWEVTLNSGNPKVYDETISITGKRAFPLGQATLSHGINASKAYLLSFWATNASASVTGNATLKKSGPAIGGLSYYEYTIPAGSATVTLTGNVTIDELRLYPANARMRTTSYDPLIGKTAECDENNRITYYEYDNLARLRFIKDENRNIVKMYEYNNVSAAKQNGCPGVFYNNQISEVFTRGNCGAGYQGTEWTVAVAANAYTSTISQDDADAQAQLYLLKNGPTQAILNGSCKLIYYNTAQSQSNINFNCPVGTYGGAINYTVPAGRYSSLISQADADMKAAEDILANAQAYANDPVNAGACTVTNDPDWKYLDNAATNCQAINCVPHLFVLETDLSPNSPTYNQTRWKDQGTSDACGLEQICSFTVQPGFGLFTSSLSKSGNTVNFYIVLNSQNGSANWLSTNLVARINCVCIPSAGRTLNISSGGNIWQMVIDTAGYVTIRLISGSSPLGTNAFGLSGSYLIN